MKKIIISAIAKNNVIGKSSGEIPWHSKEEFAHFKSTTLGFPIIMGRKTFESLRKPLKNRLNIVLTSNNSLGSEFPEIITFDTLEKAYNFCIDNNYEKVFIIGGSQIYNSALKDADELLISYMKFNAEGDIVFPKIDQTVWKIKSIINKDEFDIYTYIRN